MKKIQNTFERFVNSPALEAGVISSTQVAASGSGYSVELLPDDTFRVIWNNQIGNKYESTGVILPLPTLDISDMQSMLADGGINEEEFYAGQFAFERDEIIAQLKELI